VLINGDADEARTVLVQALVKQFTAVGGVHDVSHYASLLAAERAARGNAAPVSRARSSTPTSRQLAHVLGRWRDPWFGDVTICRQGDATVFASERSPKLHGDVVAIGERLQVRWREADVDVDAWLLPSGRRGEATTLHMAKFDPDADFSYDFEDLAFARVGECH